MNTTSQRLLNIAHRGGRSQGTENALATIEKSLALGVDGIEIDVWQVGGELLVTHDRQLGRVIRGSGRLLDVPHDELQNLEHYDGSPVPRLQEVLATVGDKAELNIELKGPACAEAVAKTLDDFCREGGAEPSQYLVSSFDHQQLHWFQQWAPHFRRGVLVAGIPLDYAACCEALQAYSFHPSLDFISAPLVADALKRGLKVLVYTVNDEKDFADMQALGVDGVFTDRPELLNAFNDASKNGEA